MPQKCARCFQLLPILEILCGLAVFPEGTDYIEQKCMRSQKYAAEKGLPVLKNVLLPKTKGFHACLNTLRSSLDAVYDVTIGYRHRCPTLMDNVYGVDPSEVHIHIRRIPLNKIPISEDETAAWLMNTFEHKDHLLSDFKAKGHFPCQGTEGDLPMVKCLVNVIMVISLTSLGVFLLFFSVWFRLYVTLVCACLSTVTYFNIRPSPVTGIVKEMFSRSNRRCD